MEDNLLKIARDRIGFSTKQLSELLDVSESTILRLERNDNIYKDNNEKYQTSLLLLNEIYENIKPNNTDYVVAILFRYYLGSDKCFKNKSLPELMQINEYILSLSHKYYDTFRNNTEKLESINKLFVPSLLLGPFALLTYPVLKSLARKEQKRIEYEENMRKRTLKEKQLKLQEQIFNENGKAIFDKLFMTTNNLGVNSLLTIYRYLKTSSNFESIIKKETMS